MRYACLALLLLALPVEAADDFRVMKLEQDLHTLENQVRDLARQVADLKGQLTLSASQPRSSVREAVPAPETWLDAGNWDRLRQGMSEADVMAILGQPTTVRSEGTGRVLYYATEVGRSGLLGGRVTLHDGSVTEVTRPRLQ